MRTASSASRTCSASASASEYTATVAMPSRLQVRMTKRGGQPNEAINAAIESAWAEWGRRGNGERAGLDWPDVEGIALDSLVRDGEILARLLPGEGPHAFQVQMLDPLLLDPAHNEDLPNGRRVAARSRPADLVLPNG